MTVKSLAQRCKFAFKVAAVFHAPIVILRPRDQHVEILNEYRVFCLNALGFLR
jgi:hypothetical protein